MENSCIDRFRKRYQWDSKPVIISAADLIYSFFSITLHPLKYLGLTIFSLNKKDNNLQFSYVSISVVVLRILCLVHVLVYYEIKLKTFLSGWNNSNPISSTESFSNYCLSTVVVVDITNIFIMLWKNNKVIHFYRKLVDFMQEVQVDAQVPFRNSMKLAISRLYYLRCFMFGCVGIFVLLFECLLLIALATNLPLVHENPALLFLPINLILYVALASIPYLYKVWILSVVYAVTICVTIIQQKVRMKSVFRELQKLEDIVHDFNDIFGVTLLLDCAAHIVVNSTLVFIVVRSMARAEVIMMVAGMGQVIINSTFLYALCSATNSLQFQVSVSVKIKKCQNCILSTF